MKNILFLLLICVGCTKSNVTIVAENSFLIQGTNILKNNEKVQLIGANAMHSFGGGSADMKLWKMDIVREFVGNMKENPLAGNAVLDANGSYLHSLQNIVNDNRNNGFITILCPFGWDGKTTSLFTGTRPTLTPWYNDYKTKLKEWATQFKNQPDVWIEVWNEPYRYDRADGYTDAIWMNDMNEMLSLIRSAGNNNIALIPCAEQGQDESVLINKATSFLASQQNVLFDIHAYEKWLLPSANTVVNRIQLLQQKNIPFLFGEVGPMNAGVLMDTAPFLNSIHANHISVCAWLWKYDSTDQDALLDSNGNPNNFNNNNWGSVFKTLCMMGRNP